MRLLCCANSFISDHITIDNYYYLLSLSKTKKILYKMENNESKKVRIKNRTCYYSDDIIKLKVFNRRIITGKYFDL